MTPISKNSKSRSKQSKNGLYRILCYLGILSVIILSFQSCANMQTPTGGPKDSLPPKILNESPQNYMRNFTARRITIGFDEFVKLNNHQKEFSVSPDLDEPIISKIRRRNLIIELPDSLEENTTYTINLGKGLVDFNESNPILNYTYVFSTGPELDSLSISGTVSNGFTKGFDKEKDKDINVILIPVARDSIFGKKKASIFTTVDTSGTFKFQNLREDTYRIYAIKEQNNDRIFNGTDEWIGFLDDSIYLNKDISGIHLELSPGTPQVFRIMDRKIESDGTANLIFNKSLDSGNIRILNDERLESEKVIQYSALKDSAKIYLPDLEFDSIRLEITSSNEMPDTLLLRKPRNLKLERSIKPIFNITNKVDRVKHITLTANRPLKSVHKPKMVLTEDSVRRNFQLEQDSVNQSLYHIRFNWKPKKDYELLLEPEAMFGRFEETNEESKLNFTLNEAENYGDIHLNITGLDTTQQYIVELISENKEKVFDKKIVPINHRVSYTKYPIGKFSIRIIWDRNRNNKWDPADVWTKTKQEEIWYLDRIFTIRANWEQNEDINVSFSPTLSKNDTVEEQTTEETNETEQIDEEMTSPPINK